MKQLATLLFVLLLLPYTLSAQQWQKRANVPFGQTDAPIGFSIGEKIYYGAGVGNKRFYEYDPATLKWTRKADIPGVTSERAFASGFSINGKGYTGFGYDGSPQTKKDLWEYDPATNQWTRKADLPGEARDGATVFVLNGKAYVGGGSDNSILFQDLWRYDPVTDAWTQLNNLPTGPVIFQSSFVINNTAYIVGGDIGESETNTAWRYDPVNDEWDEVADYPGAARQAATTFVFNGRGYVGFGHSRFTELFNDFHAYDPGSNSWSVVTDPTVPPARAWATGITSEGRAFMGTGFDLQSFYNDWWEYSIPVNHAPVFEDVAEQTIVTGTTMDFAIRATDAEDDPISYTVLHKPSWVSDMVIEIGGKPAIRIFGTPGTENIGDTSVRIRVTDDEMLWDEILVNIIVTAPTQNRPPHQPLLLLPENNAEVKRGDAVRFTWARTGDPDAQDVVTYAMRLQWFSIDTTINAGTDTTLLFTVPEMMPTSTYSWHVIARDQLDGTSVSLDRSITVLPAAGVSQGERTSTPLLYPNPAAQHVTLTLAATSDISIYDQLGRLVESHNVGAGTSQLDVRHLPRGVYHVRIRTGEHEQTEVLHVTQ